MEPEGIPVGGLIEVSTADAVPNGDIGIDLCGHKLGQSAQAGHSLAVLEPVQQVLGGIGLDGLQKLDLPLIDQVPNDRVVKVQVTHDLAASDQLGDRVVSHLNVRLVCSERNGPQKAVLGEGVLEQLVGEFNSGESGNAGLELCAKVWVVENSKGTGSDVIDDVLFHSQEEGLALIYQNLGDIFVHDDGTLDGVLRKILDFNCKIELAFLGGGSSGHLV